MVFLCHTYDSLPCKVEITENGNCYSISPGSHAVQPAVRSPFRNGRGLGHRGGWEGKQRQPERQTGPVSKGYVLLPGTGSRALRRIWALRQRTPENSEMPSALYLLLPLSSEYFSPVNRKWAVFTNLWSLLKLDHDLPILVLICSPGVDNLS